jgi:hypothetical protein
MQGLEIDDTKRWSEEREDGETERGKKETMRLLHDMSKYTTIHITDQHCKPIYTSDTILETR